MGLQSTSSGRCHWLRLGADGWMGCRPPPPRSSATGALLPSIYLSSAAPISSALSLISAPFTRPRSGGFRELCLPIARELGVPPKNLFANRMNFQVDDETGEGGWKAGGARIPLAGLPVQVLLSKSA